MPDDGLPVEERDAVRVVVLDIDDRILLFKAWKPERPEVGSWWELPGGGIEPGESVAAAAIRELYEETGIEVSPDQLSLPSWRRTSTFRYHNARRLQHEVVVTARLVDRGPDADVSNQYDYELEEYEASRWWPVAEVCASHERFYPGRLPELLASHLADQQIDEPFELWD